MRGAAQETGKILWEEFPGLRAFIRWLLAM